MLPTFANDINTSRSNEDESVEFVSSQSTPPMPEMTYGIVIQMCILLCLFTTSLLGNIRTLCLVRHRTHMRNQYTMNRLVYHLVIADLLVTFFCLLGDAVWHLSVQWYAGTVACKLFKYGQALALASSTFITVVISIDRARAVVNPFSKGSARSNNILTAMLAAAWIISLIVSLPQLVRFEVSRGPWEKDFYQCVSIEVLYPKNLKHKGATFAYFIANVVILFLIPLCVIVISYGLILTKIMIKSRELNRSFSTATPHLGDNKTSTDTVSTSDHNHLLNSEINIQKDVQQAPDLTSAYAAYSKRTLLQRAIIRSFQMFSIMIVVFVLLWLPYWILYTYHCISLYTGGTHEATISEMSNFVFFFGMAISAINPIIYGSFQSSICCIRRETTNNRPVIIMKMSWPHRRRAKSAADDGDEEEDMI